MIKSTAAEISKRLTLICMSKIIGSGAASKSRLLKIRNHIPEQFDNEYKKVILSRAVELISLAIDIPYEIETLLLIMDTDLLKTLLSEFRKSAKLLEEMDNVELETYELDNDFFLHYALYSLDNC
ncbi:hypothetical protein [Methanobrevibacter sp.]